VYGLHKVKPLEVNLICQKIILKIDYSIEHKVEITKCSI
jgi:hypothetical protein